MSLESIVSWMIGILLKDGCIYQEDVVDYLIKNNVSDLIEENQNGNLVLASDLINSFKKQTIANVVWVKKDKYWRYRVPEDDQGREARD